MSKPTKHVTVLSPNTTINGDLSVDNDLRLAGILEGSLLVNGNLVIESTGTVKGDIKIKTGMIAGKVEGNIEVEGKIILEPKSKVYGDINAKTNELQIMEGAVLRGNIKMGNQEASSKTDEKAG